jgi:hypothetical protein
LSDQPRKNSPELTASFLSRLIFAWFDKTVWRGRSKTIDESDLWDLNPGANVIKTFKAVIYKWAMLSWPFVPGKPVQPGIIF